ncbi:hemolymph lipopolysaccharide-binding protein-like [Hetaerina americana]|uniref:hemolymph lipopolysaccharide-binding protein-like n=1 Tax=Hetaerina americana TaxID=62018 RepID=UPI003A7F3DA6
MTEYAGIQSFHLGAVAIAPPQLPADYQLFPGVGYYKFHTALANGFEDASSRCANEGGHLAIVNSEAEHQVLQTLFAKHPESELKTVWAFVGFHDRLKEGEFVTIFGQPLQSTGFTRWSSPGQPDDYNKAEDCGTVRRNGGLNDIGCASVLPFFCEYDLSWAEN